MEQILDVMIVGSGPEGLSAAIYGKRAKLKIAVAEKEYEGTGQIAESGRVDNYPGLPEISGYDLGERFRDHAVKLGVEFIELEVTSIEESFLDEHAGSGSKNIWKITFEDGSCQLAKTVVYAAGATPRKMNIPGEAEFIGKEISFCAICDGAFYKDKIVAVIGGGDTALDDALYLSKICRKVYLIHRRDTFRGAAHTVELVKNTETIELILKANVERFCGQKTVSEIVLIDGRVIAVDGVFMAIGSVPQTSLVENIVSMDENGYIYADENGKTSRPGIFAAGDVRVKKLRQVITAVADGACASGMAALFNALTNILRSGDEIISSASLYGGSIDLFRDLEAFGITTRYVENNNWEEINGAFNEHTRLVFAETIGNPRLDVTDVEKLGEIAHQHGVPLIVDNTTATAYLFQPLKHGADIVVNSSSKYINGSSNAISGVLTDGGKFKWDKEKYPGLKDFVKFGPMAYIAKLRNGLFRNTGACLSPQNAFLNQIGMETLGLRMERQCDNAYALARWIEENYSEVEVNYPGLTQSNWHEIAKRQFEKGFGAIVTIRVGSKEKAFKLIDSLKIPYTLSNIGDTKTLVIHPASTISLHSTVKQQEDAGVFDDLIRISVGIEDIEDLKEDFSNAFAQLKQIEKTKGIK